MILRRASLIKLSHFTSDRHQPCKTLGTLLPHGAPADLHQHSAEHSLLPDSALSWTTVAVVRRLCAETQLFMAAETQTTTWGLEYTIIGAVPLVRCIRQHTGTVHQAFYAPALLLAECPKKHSREVTAVFPGLDAEGVVGMEPRAAVQCVKRACRLTARRGGQEWTSGLTLWYLCRAAHHPHLSTI